jgi:hypothetical protein
VVDYINRKNEEVLATNKKQNDDMMKILEQMANMIFQTQPPGGPVLPDGAASCAM